MQKNITQFNLPVSILKEGNKFVAYTPALDLSTYGETFKAAQANFMEAVVLFFEELNEMGTGEQVLSDLGWEKQDETFSPPVVISHQSESFSLQVSS